MQSTTVVTAGQTNPAFQGPQTNPTATQNSVANYSRGQSVAIGILLIITGALSIIFNIVDLAVNSSLSDDFGYDEYKTYYRTYDRYGSTKKTYSSLGHVGHGFWIGILLIATGCIAIGSKTRCMITAFFIMSIITGCFAFIMFCIGAAGADSFGDLLDLLCEKSAISDPCDKIRAVIAMEALLAVAGVVGFAMSLWGTIISGMAICRTSSTPTPGYVIQPAAPVVVTTQQQQPGMMMQPGYFAPAQPYPVQANQQPMVVPPPYGQQKPYPNA